jgi:hypothetical protein
VKNSGTFPTFGTKRVRGACWSSGMHSYEILGAGMLLKPEEARKFIKIRENLLNFIKIGAEECFDKVLNEELKKSLMCKMKNVIIRPGWD